MAIACLALIGGLAWLVYDFAIAPPSAESLLQKLDATKDPDTQREIAARYLKHYGNRDDEATRKVKSLDRELKVKEREHVLLNRFGRENLRGRPEADDDREAYMKTMAALTAENDGDLASARKMWTELAEQYSNDLTEAKKLWGWHAQKKLNDLAFTRSQLAELVKKLDANRLDDVDPRFEDELQSRVIEAIRLEQLGDFSLAQDRWEQIAKTLKGNQDRRAEFVLASGKAKDLESNNDQPKDAAARATLIASTIARAKAIARHVHPRTQTRWPQSSSRHPRCLRRRIGRNRQARRAGEKAAGGQSAGMIFPLEGPIRMTEEGADHETEATNHGSSRARPTRFCLDRVHEFPPPSVFCRDQSVWIRPRSRAKILKRPLPG